MRFEDFSLLFLIIGKSRGSNGKRRGFFEGVGVKYKKNIEYNINN